MMKSPFAKPDAAALVAAWRAAHTGRDLDDWHTAAVDDVAHAITHRRDASESARLLGRHRAGAGIGMREGLEDLETPYRVHSRTAPPHAVSRAFAEGWADAEVESLIGRASIDSLTGLATYDYVCARLGEIYAESPDIERCFVIVDAPNRLTNGPARLARSLGLSNLLRSVFSTGETTAILPHGLFVALVTRCDSLGDSLQRLSRGVGAFETAADTSGRVRVWVEALPRTQKLAEKLLLELDAA
jgi:hypothetical protein